MSLISQLCKWTIKRTCPIYTYANKEFTKRCHLMKVGIILGFCEASMYSSLCMANSTLQLFFASTLTLQFLGLVLQTAAYMCRVCVCVCLCACWFVLIFAWVRQTWSGGCLPSAIKFRKWMMLHNAYLCKTKNSPNLNQKGSSTNNIALCKPMPFHSEDTNNSSNIINQCLFCMGPCVHNHDI